MPVLSMALIHKFFESNETCAHQDQLSLIQLLCLLPQLFVVVFLQLNRRRMLELLSYHKQGNNCLEAKSEVLWQPEAVLSEAVTLLLKCLWFSNHAAKTCAIKCNWN